MDLLTNKGKKLADFCQDNGLLNFVSEPTRSVTTKTGTSSTLIDVVLHNNSKISRAAVFDFPYSDHKIVTIECTLTKSASTSDQFESRKLNEKNIKIIEEKVKLIDLSFLNHIDDVEVRLFFFNKLIMDVIDEIAPLKKMTNKPKQNSQPWYDIDCVKAKRLVDKSYVKFKKK